MGNVYAIPDARREKERDFKYDATDGYRRMEDSLPHLQRKLLLSYKSHIFEHAKHAAAMQDKAEKSGPRKEGSKVQNTFYSPAVLRLLVHQSNR